mmetsp:Transcript_3595/g.9036  ORF Transcript_3595/g.9036 Transcript_3595/m.9036 type:complete len:229 (-) Transcript_3595:1572-2258(-)
MATLAPCSRGMDQIGGPASASSSIPKIAWPYDSIPHTMAATPAQLSAKPGRSMSRTSSRPVAKAIAFGGVDTGSMKASELASAAGIMSSRGSHWSACATVARMGRTMVQVATLEQTSVAIVTNAQSSVSSSGSDMDVSAALVSRRHASRRERPEAVKPSASAKPPPSSNKTSHGMLRAASQSSNLGASCGVSRGAAPGCGAGSTCAVALPGRMKRQSVVDMITVASLT